MCRDIFNINTQEDKKPESPENSTPQNKKKGKKKTNRFKNHIKARTLISRLSKPTGGQNKERPSSPTLSYDSGSGDEDGLQLGIGVKTFEKKISDTVSVHWPVQCQVGSILSFGRISSSGSVSQSYMDCSLRVICWPLY